MKECTKVHIGFKTPSGVPMTNVMRRWALPLAIVLLAGAACGPLAPEQTLPEMSLKKVSGTVEIIRGGDTITVGEETDIEPDDVIRTSGRDALAKLRLEGDRLLELKGRGSTVVDSPTSVEVQSGQVLVRAEEVTRVLVDSVEASASAAQFRVDRGFGSARVSSYSGTVAVESPGQQRLDIRSFFEAAVTAGEIPQSARPYRMQPDDPWDALILQKWVSLEEELKVLSNSLTNNLGGDRPDIAYFSELAGGEAGFVRSFLDRRVADLLIGFTIANNSDPSLKQAFRRAFSLFDEGATWGITSAIMEIEPRPLLAQLGRTILGTGVAVAGGAQTGGASFSVAAADLSASGGGIQPPASGGGTTSPGDSPGVSGGGGGNPGGGDPGGGNPGGGGGGGEKPKECQTGDVQCTIDDLTNPSPKPSPSILNLDLDLDDGVLD
jgi:hypothetical protein